MDRAGNGRPLRKVPTPGSTGSGGSPTGESPSSGAETTQPEGTRKVPHRRFPRDMLKRPSPREQALTDGRRSFPDRRGERGVECCLEQNGAYDHDLAGPSGDRRTARPATSVAGRETPPLRARTARIRAGGSRRAAPIPSESTSRIRAYPPPCARTAIGRWKPWSRTSLRAAARAVGRRGSWWPSSGPPGPSSAASPRGAFPAITSSARARTGASERTACHRGRGEPPRRLVPRPAGFCPPIP